MRGNKICLSAWKLGKEKTAGIAPAVEAKRLHCFLSVPIYIKLVQKCLDRFVSFITSVNLTLSKLNKF